MSFLRPEFLWALPLAALPILIHLLNRRRFVRVDFGAMEFLRRALRRTRRRLFLEDLILLLLRTAAVLALILALARPAVDPGTLFAGRPARAEVLLLDVSLSMSHREAGSSAYERAVHAGEQRLEDLDLARGDRAALVWVGAPARRLAYGDPMEVRAALAERDRPERGRADWAGAFDVAEKSAESLAREGAEHIRITLLSDFQSSGFDLAGGDGAALESLAQGGYDFDLLDCGAQRRVNTAVVGLEVEPAELSPGAYGEVHAFFRHFGGEPRDGVRVSLFLDGVPAANTELSFAAGEQKEWSTAIAPAETGSRALEVRLDGDALGEDDARSAILPVRPAPRVLLVGEPAPFGEPANVFDTLRRFLDLGEGAPVRLEAVAPGRVDAALLDLTDVALLADPGPLPAGTLAALADFHLAGGGLLLAACAQTEPGDAAALLAAVGVEGVELDGVIDASEPSARIAIRDPQYPPLSLFRDPRWQPLLTEVPVSRYRLLRELAPAGAPAEAPLQLQTPLVFVRSTGESATPAEGDPVLLQWRGGGRSGAVWTAPPLPGWNRLAELPGGVLPLLFDLLAHLAPHAGHSLLLEVGRPLEVELARLPTDVTVTDPAGSTQRLSTPAVALAGGRARQPVLEAAPLDGVWTVLAHFLDRDGSEQVAVEKVAVVLPPAESDLAALDPEKWSVLLPGATLLRAGDASSVADAQPQDSSPRDYSSLLFALVLGCLALETGLAAWLDRRRG
ncbi:MAG: hypothetical protein EYC70_06835 [Planctomycetota bacterium]|nr:MAG: hypothetical protein EYC70_06835 [Planctomycetota bacterium]